MPSREQFARAVGAIAAGFAVAWEHLREPVEIDTVVVPPFTGCPICGLRVTDTPHVHGQDVIWPTGTEGVLMLTDLGCADPFVIPEAGA